MAVSRQASPGQGPGKGQNQAGSQGKQGDSRQGGGPGNDRGSVDLHKQRDMPRHSGKASAQSGGTGEGPRVSSYPGSMPDEER